MGPKTKRTNSARQRLFLRVDGIQKCAKEEVSGGDSREKAINREMARLGLLPPSLARKWNGKVS